MIKGEKTSRLRRSVHTQSPLRTAFPIIILPQLVLVGTIVLVLLQLVFMVWEIVLVIGAWRYLCIELFR